MREKEKPILWEIEKKWRNKEPRLRAYQLHLKLLLGVVMSYIGIYAIVFGICLVLLFCLWFLPYRVVSQLYQNLVFFVSFFLVNLKTIQFKILITLLNLKLSSIHVVLAILDVQNWVMYLANFILIWFLFVVRNWIWFVWELQINSIFYLFYFLLGITLIMDIFMLLNTLQIWRRMFVLLIINCLHL